MTSGAAWFNQPLKYGIWKTMKQFRSTCDEFEYFLCTKEVVVTVLIFRCDNDFVYRRAISFRDTHWNI